MKTIIKILAASQLFCCTFVAAQDLQAVNPTLPGSTVQVNPYPISNTIEGKKITERFVYGEKNITVRHFFDGFGREVKSVSVGASPTGRDIVSERVYDCMGSGDSIIYLPSVPDSLGNTLNASLRTRRFYKQLLGNDPDANYPTIQTVYDNSPLKLKIATDAPGINHSYISSKGHPVRYNYRLNYSNTLPLNAIATTAKGFSFYPGTSDGVKKYEIINDSMLYFSGYYPMSALTVTEKIQQSTDTVSISNLEYRDQEGNLVAKEVRVNGQNKQFIYNVYDSFGRLRYEIPFIQDKRITNIGSSYTPNQVSDYCTYHGYNTLGNEVLTIRPGRERIYSIYDVRNRIVLSQDGNQRPAGKWFYTKYDDFDRPIETHLITLPQSWAQLNENLCSLYGANLHALLARIKGEDILLSRMIFCEYYDYDLSDDGCTKHYRQFEIPSYLSFKPMANVVLAEDLYSDNAGLRLYEKIAVIPDVFTDTRAYIERAYYYDKEGRIVQSVERNHLGGICRITNQYDKAGNLIMNHENRALDANRTPDILITRKTYDDFGRIISDRTKLNSGPITSTYYEYDPLGRVSKMNQGGGKINTSYKYDIRGRMIKQQNELFLMALAFDKPTLNGTVSNYAGYISECKWAFTDENYFSCYAFSYTPKGQLQNAYWYRNGTLQTSSYAESLKYDDNNNILALTRYGDRTIENSIRYRYKGNLLMSTSDRGHDANYMYDLNGNLISSSLNICTYRYNYLNLIEEVCRYGTTAASYKYLSDGTKLEVGDKSGNGYLYSGSLIYTKSGNSYTLESANFPSGRITASTNGYKIQYYITDYLGSVRVVADQMGRILEKFNYYPFGKRWVMADQQLSDNRLLFNGKEWQVTGDVKLLDYGARMYDPNLGRWFVQDPMYQTHNPYTFCFNNPINRIDPNGMYSTEDGDGDGIDNANILGIILQILKDMLDGKIGPEPPEAYTEAYDKYDEPNERNEKDDNTAIKKRRNNLAFNERERLKEHTFHYFKSKWAAWTYMWKASHKYFDGQYYGYKEHAAYDFSNGGVLLLPSHRNSSTISYTYENMLEFDGKNCRLKNGKQMGYPWIIVGYTHTHDASDTIEVSNYDRDFASRFPSLIVRTIANGGNIYRIFSDGSYQPIGVLGE
uniref:DUF6443 domain-containing protein n=1 Tax=Alistipes sp. D31t1_170403_E11 TaxID=2787128 RepID=UPI00189B35A3|nr:RHS repeat-associated core domain-containing protein [Alistipes sp. D31t1_170403_E11]